MSRQEQINAARSCFYQGDGVIKDTLPLVAKSTYEIPQSDSVEEVKGIKRYKIDFMIRMFVAALIFAGVLQWSQVEKDHLRLSMVKEYLAKGEYLNQKSLEESVKDVEVFANYVKPYVER